MSNKKSGAHVSGSSTPTNPPKTTVDLDDDESIESDLEVPESDEDLAEDADVVGRDDPPPSGGKP